MERTSYDKHIVLVSYEGESLLMIHTLRRLVAVIDRHRIWYDIFMAILAVGIIVSLIIDSRYNRNITFIMETQWFDRFVWIVFTIDYVARLLVARNRFYFIRHNIIEAARYKASYGQYYWIAVPLLAMTGMRRG